MEHFTNLEHWFAEIALNANIRPSVSIYVAQTLAKPKIDVKSTSIVLSYVKAVKFSDYQNVGDDALWRLAMSNEHANVVVECGKRAYSVCYHLLRKKVDVYEELADDLNNIADRLRFALQQTRV